MATREEMQTIRNQAYDDVAREMARDGVTLTHNQWESLGADEQDWLEKRLGLRLLKRTFHGMEYASENAREPSDEQAQRSYERHLDRVAADEQHVRDAGRIR